MKASIISIGNELLNGSVINTNATFISKSLYEIGIRTDKILVIPDDYQAIIDTLEDSSGLVIITGGLGPTSDDITKKCLADYLKSSLEFHQPTYHHIKDLFGKRGMEVSELNRQQAYVVKGCKVLFNALGTAPGMYFEYQNKHIFALQGVPFEMKKIMIDEVIPILVDLGFGIAFYHRILQTTGIPESHLQQLLIDWETTLPSNVQIAYLPEPGNVKIRLSLIGDEQNHLIIQAETLVQQLNQIIGEYIWGYDKDTFAGVIAKMLNEHNASLSLAESCTGGYLSHLITSLPGSSSFFKGGVISYSNEVKEELLSVNQTTLQKFGAVSRETVIEMAEGVRRLTKTNYSIAITGIAGPNGATENKPVGYVWIAVACKNETIVEQFNFSSNRMVNITRASIAGLNMLRLMLKRIE